MSITVSRGDVVEIIDPKHLKVGDKTIHTRKIGPHPTLETTTFYLRMDIAGTEIIEVLACDGLMRVMAVFRSSDHFERLPEYEGEIAAGSPQAVANFLQRDPDWCYTCDRPKSDCGCVENGGTY
jgi:hypothetical protein